jgi:hypothetical protein
LQTTILEEWAINTSVCRRLIVVHHRRWTATQPWRANMINSHLEPPLIQLLPLNINGELQIVNTAAALEYKRGIANQESNYTSRAVSTSAPTETQFHRCFLNT